MAMDPRDRDHIIAHVLGRDVAWVMAHREEPWTTEQTAAIQALLARREQHEPLAYLLGHQPFYGRSFIVNSDVLIPRPESELIIDAVKTDLADIAAPMIVDVGTGSGCLAITAALELPQAQVTAIDLSPAALTVAKQNAQVLRTPDIRFIQGDLLQPVIDAKWRADAIMANLPYVPQQDIDLSPTANELAYEPQQALLADDAGLALIKRCTEQAAQVLKPHGKLYLEMLPDQIPAFSVWLMLQGLPFSSAILQDLSGQNRLVVLTNLVEG